MNRAHLRPISCPIAVSRADAVARGVGEELNTTIDIDKPTQSSPVAERCAVIRKSPRPCGVLLEDWAGANKAPRQERTNNLQYVPLTVDLVGQRPWTSKAQRAEAWGPCSLGGSSSSTILVASRDLPEEDEIMPTTIKQAIAHDFAGLGRATDDELRLITWPRLSAACMPQIKPIGVIA